MLLPYHTDSSLEAGTDEAGRGCLAGPVYAAAVILPRNFSHPFLRDSKKLTVIQRDELFEFIKMEAISYAIKPVTHKQIDKINILNASILAMHKSLKALDPQPEYILVDGNRFKPYKKIPYECVIKGDDKYFSIAAASVLAKVSRDRYMTRMAKKYPYYSWNTNMGYPTRAHRSGIENHGASPIHRKSFKLLANMGYADQMALFKK